MNFFLIFFGLLFGYMSFGSALLGPLNLSPETIRSSVGSYSIDTLPGPLSFCSNPSSFTQSPEKPTGEPENDFMPSLFLDLSNVIVQETQARLTLQEETDLCLKKIEDVLLTKKKQLDQRLDKKTKLSPRKFREIRDQESFVRHLISREQQLSLDVFKKFSISLDLANKKSLEEKREKQLLISFQQERAENESFSKHLSALEKRLQENCVSMFLLEGGEEDEGIKKIETEIEELKNKRGVTAIR